MKILVIGNGARENAICWKLFKSPMVNQVFIAPGNFGTSKIGTNVDIAPDDIEGLLAFAYENKIDLTVVGPEKPLVDGIVDVFRNHDLKIIGPDKNASQLEGSKAYSKEFMMKYDIPTAKYEEHTDFNSAVSSLSNFDYPVVIKADGLASGKGVIIAGTKDEAVLTLKEILIESKFGESGNKVVIEEFLDGVEASVICLVDNGTIVPLETAQDYKKAFDGDEGPNTGGMGSYSPSKYIDEEKWDLIKTEVIDKTYAGLRAEQYDFRGIIFIGIMMNDNGVKVLEYNVRFGDPETQSILARLDSDLCDIFLKMHENKLGEIKLEWLDEVSVSVVMASGGYPEAYEKGKVVKLPMDLYSYDDIYFFAAGLVEQETDIICETYTKMDNTKVKECTLVEDDSEFIPVTNGGRVLTITALGSDFEEAIKKAYSVVNRIEFSGAYFRKDIGK
jgi:phosphoribosylamine--glycine ligase